MSESGPILAAIAALAQRFDKLEQRFEKLEQRFDKLEARVEDIAQDLTRFRADIMERLDRQQDLLTSLQNDIGVNMAGLDRSRTGTRAMQDEVHALGSQVSLVHRRLIALEQRVDRQERL